MPTIPGTQSTQEAAPGSTDPGVAQPTAGPVGASPAQGEAGFDDGGGGGLEAMLGALSAGCSEQARALRALADGIGGVVDSSRAIDEAGRAAGASIARARATLGRIAEGVEGALQALRQVATAAQEIGQVAHQTRLVAFSASVEAKRGESAGQGFGVVAEAVRDLATKIEQSSALIANSISRLDEDVGELAAELSEDDALRERSRLRLALAHAEEQATGVARNARHGLLVCTAAADRMRGLASRADDDARALGEARRLARRTPEAPGSEGEPAGDGR